MQIIMGLIGMVVLLAIAARGTENLAHGIALCHGEYFCWPDRSAAGRASLHRHHDAL